MSANQTYASIGDVVSLTCPNVPISDISAQIWYAPSQENPCVDGCYTHENCNVEINDCINGVVNEIYFVTEEPLLGNWTCYIATSAHQLWNSVNILRFRNPFYPFTHLMFSKIIKMQSQTILI